jgi:hypothetical protein
MSLAELSVTRGDGEVPVFQKIQLTGPDRFKWFGRGDFDAFVMLWCDNMASLIAIIGVMANTVPAVAITSQPNGGAQYMADGYADEFAKMVWLRVCPGIAMSMAFGNLWYSWMAAKLAAYDKRQDVTALPYGINTPAGFLAAYNIMLPLASYYLSNDPTITKEDWVNKTFQSACACNFLGGIVEILGAFVGKWCRSHLSKAALTSTLAAVGFVWLAFEPFVQVCKEPIVGILPLALVFTAFFSNRGKGYYGKVTGGGALIIMLLGILLKWVGAAKYYGSVSFMQHQVDDAWDTYAGKNEMMKVFPLGNWDKMEVFICIVVPVAIQVTSS